MTEILAFIGTILGVLAICAWSIWSNDRQLRKHAEKMDEIYRRRK